MDKSKDFLFIKMGSFNFLVLGGVDFEIAKKGLPCKCKYLWYTYIDQHGY
jgi:hypothetical protein